jgi:hypothetical protein
VVRGGGGSDNMLPGPPPELTRYGLALLSLAQACSPWGRWRIMQEMEAGGLLHGLAGVVVDGLDAQLAGMSSLVLFLTRDFLLLEKSRKH